MTQGPAPTITSEGAQPSPCFANSLQSHTVVRTVVMSWSDRRTRCQLPDATSGAWAAP